MKKPLLGILGIGILCLPIVVIGVVYLLLRINIFNNPDFWYGYMAYFGTTFLAIISLWQNENANRTNRSLSEKNLYYQKVTSQRLFPIVTAKDVSVSKCVPADVLELKHLCPPKACTFDRYAASGNSDEVLTINCDIDYMQDKNQSTYKKSIHLNICNSSEVVIRHICINDIVISGYTDQVPTMHCKNATAEDGFAYFLMPNESFALTIDIYFKNKLLQKIYDWIGGGIKIVLYLTNTAITGVQQKQHIVIHTTGNLYGKVSYGDRIYTEETNDRQTENADVEKS